MAQGRWNLRAQDRAQRSQTLLMMPSGDRERLYHVKKTLEDAQAEIGHLQGLSASGNAAALQEKARQIAAALEKL